ncbi:DUF397 domain-containing protein [Streptomyces werraensis]|uniref:DUF397 domain-containing protein n=1 Tax=Streptomyces werraensis TaxID=68284 RepID=UPI00341B2B3E
MPDKSTLNSQQVAAGSYYKSSYSGSGSGSDCLEVAPLVGGVRVRDSKKPDGPTLNFFAADFQALIDAVKTETLLKG